MHDLLQEKSDGRGVRSLLNLLARLDLTQVLNEQLKILFDLRGDVLPIGTGE